MLSLRYFCRTSQYLVQLVLSLSANVVLIQAMKDSLYQYHPFSNYNSVSDTMIVSKESFVTEQLFGENSMLDLTLNGGDSLALADVFGRIMQWETTLIILLLFALYSILLYRYSALFAPIFKIIFSIGRTNALLQNQSIDESRFLRYTKVLLIFTLSIALASVCHFMPQFEQFDIFIVLSAILLFIVSSSIISLVLRKITALFDYNKSRWELISNLVKFDRAIIVVFFAPIVMVCAFSEFFVKPLIFVCLVLYFYHFMRIILIFKEQGFSFLQSILYICAVEIAPVVLLWGIVSRLKVL